MSACIKCGHNPEAQVSASWQVYVPRTVKSGNAHVHNVGGSRWEYGAERRAWVSDMTGLALIHGISKATAKRRITLTRCYGKRKREYDRDNFATGCKPIVDAMIKAGIIVGDRPDQAEIHYAQERASSGVDGLRVLIEELASDAPEAGSSKGPSGGLSKSSEPHTERSRFVRESDDALTIGTETAGGR